VTERNFDRFRRLERPRAPGAGEAPRSAETDARIEAVEGPAPEPPAAAAPSPSGGDLERFRAPAAPTLELDLQGESDQPFRRCASCETDNYRTATRCTTCGADLDTEAQRDFNRRFWAGRLVTAATEAQASAARQAQLDADQVSLAAERREAAEAMARQVGEQERQRLEREGFGPTWTDPLDAIGMGRPRGSLLLGWLRAMPMPWAIATGALLLLVPLLLFLFQPVVGIIAGVVILALFSPPRRRSWFDRSNWD
jgi:hypothetical protein